MGSIDNTRTEGSDHLGRRRPAAIPDSGKRQQFSTGSQRDDQAGKGYYHLLPPDAIRRLALRFEAGARKYALNNWRRGQPISRYLNSAMRHQFKFIEGHRDEDHLGAACWNLLAAMETEAMIERGLLPAELDDRTDYLHHATGFPQESADDGNAEPPPSPE